MFVSGLAFADLIKAYFVSPTLLRVVRVFRVGRVLRLVKSAKGIRTLLFSLAVSLPALFNIGLLLFLVMFIYAIFGMSFFMHVAHTAGLDENFNFETFGRSMILLFQISTSAGWDSVLGGLMNEDECSNEQTELQPNGNCGSSALGIVYLVTYLVISFLVVINMYIAVILENFSQATEDVQQGLTQDDFDMFYEVWERYDEEATEYISLTRLSEFVDELEEPLRIPIPNYYRMVFLNIPICENEKVHCVDILDGLTKNFLGTAEEGTDLPPGKGPERHDYHPISTTLKRQREVVCAKTVQKAWRECVARRKGLDSAAATKDGVAGAEPEAEGEQPLGTVESLPRTIVNIEEVDEEVEDTDKSKSEESSKDSSKEEGKQEDSKQKTDSLSLPSSKKSDPDPDPDDAPPGDDPRTVELYPESGVVA